VIDTPPLLHTFNGFDLFLLLAVVGLARLLLNPSRRR
jgi:hypothetical protein